MAQSCEALATKAELVALKRELQPLKVQVAGIGYEVDGLGGKLIELVVVTTGAIGALKDRIAQAVGDIPALRARMARDLAALKAELDPRLRSLEGTLRRISEQLPNFVTDRELAALREQLEANANELPVVYENRLTALYNELNQIINNLKIEITHANGRVAEANRNIVELAGALQALQGSISETIGKTAANSIAVAAINARVARVEQEVANILASQSPNEADYDGDIAGLRSDIGYLQSVIDRLNASIEGNEALIRGIGNDLTRALQAAQAAQTTANTANSGVATVTRITSDLDGRIGNVNATTTYRFQSIDNNILQLRNNGIGIGTIDSRIASTVTPSLNTLTQNQITLNDRITDLQGTDTSIDERLTVLEGVGVVDLFDISSRLDDVETGVNANTVDIENLNTATSDLYNAVNIHTIEIDNLEEGVALNEEQYTALTTGITDLNAKVDRTNLGIAGIGTAASAYLYSRLAPSLTQLISQTAPLAQTLEREFAQVKAQVSPASLSQAAATGVCSTTKPGGCLGSGGNWQKGLMNNFGNILGAGNAALSGLILQLSQSTNAIVKRTEPIIKSINTKQDLLGNALKGFQDFSEKAWKATQFDKVLAIMNFVLATHNAMMLSRNLVSTLGEAASTTLRFLKVKSPTGGDIDVNQVIGTSITNYLNQIFGAANIAATKATFAKYNRILTAANGVMMGLRQIKDASIEAAEIGFGWVAKIGNAMKIQGILEEDAFPWMKEQPGFRQHYQGFRNKVDNIDTAASQANAFVSTGVEVQQGITDSTTAFTELVKAIDEFDMEKTTVEGAAQLESESPLIDRLNLLKKEPDDEG